LLVLVGGSVLLVLICTSLMCFVGVRSHHTSLLCLISAHRKLCLVSDHLHLLDVFCQCLYALSCCVLLVLVNASLP
jgi:hypothetical protein